MSEPTGNIKMKTILVYGAGVLGSLYAGKLSRAGCDVTLLARGEHLRCVSETLLITLYIRAMESLRPDGLIKDDDAVTLFRRMSNDGSYDFSRMELLGLSDENKLVIILRSRAFDRYVQSFLRRESEAVVVQIGCGLDTRYRRTITCRCRGTTWICPM